MSNDSKMESIASLTVEKIKKLDMVSLACYFGVIYRMKPSERKKYKKLVEMLNEQYYWAARK